MLLKTYQKVVRLFTEYHGYMNFDSLRRNGITVLQMRELESEGVLQRFARGWYWCGECGISKPQDYKYVEIGMVNPNAIICLDSACFLNGILSKEPAIVKVATAREDRKKMEIQFPIARFYFANMGMEEEIKTKNTEFGSYKYFARERSLCDCMRKRNKVEFENMIVIENTYQKEQDAIIRFQAYL